MVHHRVADSSHGVYLLRGRPGYVLGNACVAAVNIAKHRLHVVAPRFKGFPKYVQTAVGLLDESIHAVDKIVYRSLHITLFQ